MSPLLRDRSSLFFEQRLNWLGRLRSTLVQIPKAYSEQTYVDKLLEIVVKIRKVILPPLIIRNELLLPLQQLLSLVLQSLTLRPLVVYPRKHERVFVVVGVIGELREEVLCGDEGELLVLVAVTMLVSYLVARKGGRLTRSSHKQRSRSEDVAAHSTDSAVANATDRPPASPRLSDPSYPSPRV